MKYQTPEEILHLNEPQRVKDLIEHVYPELIIRHKHDI